MQIKINLFPVPLLCGKNYFSLRILSWDCWPHVVEECGGVAGLVILCTELIPTTIWTSRVLLHNWQRHKIHGTPRRYSCIHQTDDWLLYLCRYNGNICIIKSNHLYFCHHSLFLGFIKEHEQDGAASESSSSREGIVRKSSVRILDIRV